MKEKKARNRNREERPSRATRSIDEPSCSKDDANEVNARNRNREERPSRATRSIDEPGCSKDDANEVNANEVNVRGRKAKERANRKLTENTNLSPSTRTRGSIVKESLDKVIEVGEELNPVCFELPPELQVRLVMPGDDKIPVPGKVGGSRRSSASRKKPYELDTYGLVPLPAKVCYYCKKSCAKGILLACDYCPLLYHLDCLDPPLTFVPTGIWMCPNHPQHLIDEVLWNGTGFSERVALWEKYGINQVDEHKVKIDFLRKVHSRKYHPFRVKTNNTLSIQVPEYVKEAYKNPMPKEFSPRDLLRASIIYQREVENMKIEKKKKEHLATPEEQELAINMAIQMNLDALVNLRKNEKSKKATSTSSKETLESRNGLEEPCEKMINGNDKTYQEDAATTDQKTSLRQIKDPVLLLDELTAFVNNELKTYGDHNGEIDTSSEIDEYRLDQINYEKLNSIKVEKAKCKADKKDENETTKSNAQERSTPEESASIKNVKEPKEKQDNKENLESRDDLDKLAVEDYEEIIESLDIKVLKYLAAKQLRQQLNDSKEDSSKISVDDSSKISVDDSSKISVYDSSKMSVDDSSKISEKKGDNSSKISNDDSSKISVITNGTAEMEIEEGPKTNEKPVESTSNIPGHNKAAEVNLSQETLRPRLPLDILLTDRPRNINLEARIRSRTQGVLLTLPHLNFKVEVPSNGNHVVIGKDYRLANPLFLSLAGSSCTRISNAHASVFFCKNTRKYWLKNYSHFGTVVDHIMCGLNMKPNRKSEEPSELRKEVEAIKSIRNKRKALATQIKPVNIHVPEDVAVPSTSTANPTTVPRQCKCFIYQPQAGYEGMIALTHGCCIKIGCVELTFMYLNQVDQVPSNGGPPAKKRKLE
ncbi:PHD finger protein 12 isoform X2 [Macrosteles quadrilineatus]|nr:PHD finger protein 12 isoform X2 [Macrosteles quadrilineatus]